jgi:uncharacterized protein YkwD
MSRALFAMLAMLAVNCSLGMGQQVSEAATSSISQSDVKTASAVSSPSPFEDPTAEHELLALVNQSRHEAGAPPLHIDASLNEAARAHARLMIERQQLSHHFDGEQPLMRRLLDTGLRLDHVGENVAFNASAEKAFEALMQSPPHRRNLLDPTFNSAGFAAFWSDHRLYVVQDFAHRLPTISPASLP